MGNNSSLLEELKVFQTWLRSWPHQRYIASRKHRKHHEDTRLSLPREKSEE